MPAVSSVESYNGRVSLAYFPAPLRRALRIGLLALHLVWGVILAGLIFPSSIPHSGTAASWPGPGACSGYSAYG